MSYNGGYWDCSEWCKIHGNFIARGINELADLTKAVELTELNTFAVCSTAATFLRLDSVESVLRACPVIQQYKQRIVLGGGSNLLFVGDYEGLVLFPQISGIEVIEETEDFIYVSVGASQNWHQFVVESLECGWYGLENLALIPGTVGASPVQNIGAYGVEVGDFIHQVHYIDLDTAEQKEVSHSDCQFAYRDSFFKKAVVGQYLITKVEFKLRKQPAPCLSYRPLDEYFNNKPASEVTPLQVFSRVCQLRREKLPDPQKIPNAGSFFKNPVISKQAFTQLKESYPKIIGYPVNHSVKLAAGWLIEEAGFKGYRTGNVGVHCHQALVLVNYGESDGQQVLLLAEQIIAKILQLFGVQLEPEVRIIGC